MRSDQSRHALRAVERGGFVLVFVVMMLFAISVAGAAGYIVVNTEFAMARSSDEGAEALAVARAGLHRFVAEQLGVVGNGVTMQLKRTEPRRFGKELLPYAVDVVGLDQPGVVHSLSGFFAARKVEIAEVSTRSYAATHTGAPMFSVQMSINIPASVHISVLREEFMDFCDQLNVDAIMEPVKHS
jgi:glycine cleavage system regulatory protein